MSLLKENFESKMKSCVPTNKFRRFCFTWNNYPKNWIALLEALYDVVTAPRTGEPKPYFSYICGAQEVGEKKGTPHIQGYMECLNSMMVKTIQAKAKTLGIAFALLVCKGTAEENITYCLGPYEKGGKVKPINETFWEIGDPKIGTQGKRNDIDLIKDMIAEGKTMRDCVEVATSYQALKFAEFSLQYQKPKKRDPVEVFWFWGNSATGKTSKAIEICEKLGLDPWVSNLGKNDAFMNGYTDQAAVIFDDTRSTTFNYSMLLRLLDNQSINVNVKGGYRPWVPTHIFVTAPQHPKEMFAGQTSSDDKIEQLLRRIKYITEFTKVMTSHMEPIQVKPEDFDSVYFGGAEPSPVEKVDKVKPTKKRAKFETVGDDLELA
jgi:hypothetical protein